MTTLSQPTNSDLVLRVTGGSRNGELIPVSTPKCYLGMDLTNDAISKNPQCAIFRGREGAVIRSYGKQVLFNDAKASLHWLQEGDSIQFPNQMNIEVVQLGELKDVVSPVNRKSSKGNNSIVVENGLEGSLVILESELRSIQIQNEQSQTQLEQLDNRLDRLTEQMTMLINLSSNGTGVQVSKTNQLTAAPTAGSTAAATETAEPQAAAEQTEEKIITPIQNLTWSQTTTAESTSQQSSEADSTAEEASSLTAEETGAKTQEAVQETAATETPATETSHEVSPEASQAAIQSPTTSSPLAELDRIDKAIEESVSGYYSHTDETDEQIMAFDNDSATSEKEEAADVSVEQVISALTEEEQIISPLSPPTMDPEQSTDSTDDSDSTESAAALAEKEQRISEMERIFGGALAETETDEQSDPAETTKTESTDSSQSVDTIQSADEQLAKTFEDLTHGQNADVDSSADNPFSNGTKESFDSEPQGATSEAVASTPAASEQPKDLDSLSPMAQKLLQDVKSEDDSESEAVEMPIMLPASQRVGSQTVVFPTGGDLEKETLDSEVTSPAESVETKAEAEEPESGLSPMAQQLLQDVKSEEVEEQAKDAKLPLMVPDSERVESETVIFPKGEGNESVADILARMQEDGKWGGVPDEDSEIDPVKPAEAVEAVEAQPAESSLDSSAGSDAESDVEDYMSQLLSRMRGEEPAVAAKAEKKMKKETKSTKKETKVQKKVEEPAFVPPADPLKPEEFKPKRKATQFDRNAMRELANSNTRTNVKNSMVQHSKAKAFGQAGVGILALLMAIGYFVFSSSLSDMYFIISIVCFVLSGVLGYCSFGNFKKTKVLTGQQTANGSSENS